MVPCRSSAVIQASGAAGTTVRSTPFGILPPCSRMKRSAGNRFRPGAEAGDGLHRAIRLADQDRRDAGDIDQVRQQHAERDAGGAAGIDRVAARLQHREAGGGGQVVAGRDGMAGAVEGGAGGVHGRGASGLREASACAGRACQFPPRAGQAGGKPRRPPCPKETPVLLSRDARGVVTVTLNRPQVGNAYNEALLRALIAGLDELRADAAVRALVHPRRGPAFRRRGRHQLAGRGRRLRAGARPTSARWPQPSPCRS